MKPESSRPRRRALLSLVSLAGVLGCSDVPPLSVAPTETPPEEQHDDVIVLPDMIPPQDDPDPPGAPQVIFINFDGVTVTDCVLCSDSRTDQSFAIGKHFGASEVVFPAYAGGAASRQKILDLLEADFEPYNVTFTTARPDSGSYTMVVISPRPGIVHGVAPLDCGNLNRNDIAFVYNIGSSTPERIAQYAAHELGHSFSLMHVLSNEAIMDWRSIGGAFTTAALDTVHGGGQCFVGSVQDDHALLEAALGRRPPPDTFCPDEVPLSLPGGVKPADAMFVPLGPERIVDTRTGKGASMGRLRKDCTLPIEVAGKAGVSADATAVLGTITALGATENGFVTVYPCGAPRPDASNVNFPGPGAYGNQVQVPLGADGRICVYASHDVGILFDVAGAFAESVAGSGFVARTPSRVLDTRNAIGVSRKAPLESEQTIEISVAGLAGVPQDLRAAAFNATAVDAKGQGFVTLYPCGSPRPDTSNLNYLAGDTVARHALIPLAADGALCVYSYGSAHVLLDLAGAFDGSGGARYRARSPKRILDTRKGSGADGALEPFVTRELFVDAVDADAVVLNLTVTGTQAAGWLGAWPCDDAFPDVSNLNFKSGTTVANLVTMSLGATRKVCFISSAETDLIVDQQGTYVP